MDIDPHAILASLGVTEPTSVAPVQGGTDMAIWRVETDSGTYALRVFRPGQADDCAREAVAMRAAAAQGVAVPAIHATGMWQERAVMLIGWCGGGTVLAELMAKPWRAWQLGVLMGREQAKLHQVQHPPELLPNMERFIAYASDEPKLRSSLVARQLQPDRLLHFDYHPLNVMTDGQRITGVIDWANVAVGDPRFDVARTVSILRAVPIHPPVPRLLVIALCRLLEAGWRHGYQQIAGKLGNLAPFYAWAGLFMLRDLAQKVSAADLAAIRGWTEHWQRRAGTR